MADFEIIEADFQQYYNIDVSKLGFQRYARLLINLPEESRFIRKISPFQDWNWDKEIQSQILHTLDIIAVQYANSHRKKGSVAIKIPQQIQPEYVKKAKKDATSNKKDDNRKIQKDLSEIFERRNNRIKKVEGVINGS